MKHEQWTQFSTGKPHRQAEPASRIGRPNRQVASVGRTGKPNRQAEPAGRTGRPNRQAEPASRIGRPNRQAASAVRTGKRPAAAAIGSGNRQQQSAAAIGSGRPQRQSAAAIGSGNRQRQSARRTGKRHAAPASRCDRRPTTIAAKISPMSRSYATSLRRRCSAIDAIRSMSCGYDIPAAAAARVTPASGEISGFGFTSIIHGTPAESTRRSTRP